MGPLMSTTDVNFLMGIVGFVEVVPFTLTGFVLADTELVAIGPDEKYTTLLLFVAFCLCKVFLKSVVTDGFLSSTALTMGTLEGSFFGVTGISTEVVSRSDV